MEATNACASASATLEIDNSSDFHLEGDSNSANDTMAENSVLCVGSTTNLLQSEPGDSQNKLTTTQWNSLEATDLRDKNTQVETNSDLTVSRETSENSSCVKAEETFIEKHIDREDSNKIAKEHKLETNHAETQDDNTTIVNEAIDDQKKPTSSDNIVQTEYAQSNNSPYYIKWIMWKGVKTAIVTQNDNGPCPLLAIINILLLRRTIAFPPMQEMVTTQELMEYLGDVVLKEIPEVCIYVDLHLNFNHINLIKNLSLVYVSSSCNTSPIEDDTSWTSWTNSLELIDLSSISKVSLG